MTDEEALGPAGFIKDHDKRFTAKAKADGANSAVLLTLASDGTELPPISDICRYRTTYIERDDPGPTVQAAWDTYQPQA